MGMSFMLQQLNMEEIYWITFNQSVANLVVVLLSRKIAHACLGEEKRVITEFLEDEPCEGQPSFFFF